MLWKKNYLSLLVIQQYYEKIFNFLRNLKCKFINLSLSLKIIE